jgi:site-specific DNA-methyltransferase (adenine-specific)
MIEINKIYNEDCLVTMGKMQDNSIDCIVTSPPYNKSYWSMNQNINNGFKTKSRKITYGEFEDNLDPKDYEEQQRKLLSECLRVIKPTGSIFYNHIDILHLHTTIHPKYVHDFPMKQIIIWNRKNTPKLDKSYFFPINEYIFWLKKSVDSKPYFDRNNVFHKKNIWDISPDISNEHPAPFPIELVSNCIMATTKENDLVYDPYMGSGTTALSCVKYKRNFIGSELNNDYIKSANKMINNQISINTLF